MKWRMTILSHTQFHVLLFGYSDNTLLIKTMMAMMTKEWPPHSDFQIEGENGGLKDDSYLWIRLNSNALAESNSE